MAQPYIGEIRIFAGNYAPAGWMFCAGQLLAISDYTTLFNLIGTTYGGDGQTTFALPDMRGRLPLHQGNGYTLAQTGGVESVTLTTQQIPAHTHALSASQATGDQASPVSNLPAASQTVGLYNANTPNQTLASGTLDAVGGGQSHDNFQPYQCLDFIISLFGVYPPST